MEHISKLLPQVQSVGLAKPELMPLVSGDVKKFYLALASQLVKDSTFQQVAEVLRKVMMKIGLRAANLPTEIETLVLYEHIVEHYGGHRLNEIPLAFDMAIKGGLCDNNGEVVEAVCYENFSCIYFSKIMNAYRYWSEHEYRTLPTKSPEEQKIFTQEELDDYAREDTEWTYQMFRKGLQLIYPESSAPILKKDGLLKDGELVVEFFLRKATDQHEHIYTRINNNY